MVLAVFAVLLAWGTSFVACENPGTEACERESLATAQLVVALIGLIPVVLLTRAAWRNQPRQAGLWLVAALCIYLTWGVLNDAAVHGWDDLQVFG